MTCIFAIFKKDIRKDYYLGHNKMDHNIGRCGDGLYVLFFKIAKNADYLSKPYIQIYPPIKQLEFALDRVKRFKVMIK